MEAPASLKDASAGRWGQSTGPPPQLFLLCGEIVVVARAWLGRQKGQENIWRGWGWGARGLAYWSVRSPRVSETGSPKQR